MMIARAITSYVIGIGLLGAVAAGGAHAQETFTLRYGTLDAEDTIIGRGQAWYLDRVEELSGGRIKFESYWSEALVPARDLLDALNTGVTDVSFIVPGYFPARLPLLSVATLPTTHADAYTFGMAVHDLVNEVPALSEELAAANAVYLTSAPFPPFNIISKTLVDSIDDLQGMKVRAFAALATLVSRLGATAVSIPTPDVYTALQRGTVDAAAYAPMLIVDFKFQETAKYLWTQPFGSVVSILAMRKTTWDRLPDDLKDIFKQASVEHQAEYHRIVQIEGNERLAREALAAAGVTITPANDEATARIAEEAQAVWEDWIAEMAAKGLPAQDVVDKYRALLDEYAQSVPR